MISKSAFCYVIGLSVTSIIASSYRISNCKNIFDIAGGLFTCLSSLISVIEITPQSNVNPIIKSLQARYIIIMLMAAANALINAPTKETLRLYAVTTSWFLVDIGMILAQKFILDKV